MEVITTHINTDFDGLAAMVAASRLYPGARLVLPGGVDRNVRNFLALHRDLLDVGTYKDLPREGIRHVILVDTQMRARMGELADLLGLPGIRVTVFDHHLGERADFAPDERVVEPLGAVTTLLLRYIRERRLSLSPFEATLYALGIYMDTGSFTFAGTTAEDLDAGAFLHRSGANLDVIAEYLHYGFTDAQRALLSDLIKGAETHLFQGVAVALAGVRTAEYIGEAAAMASRLMELENAEAAILMAQMDDDLYLIGRSQTDRLDVADVLSEWGGGGHPRAASAHLRIRDMEPPQEGEDAFASVKRRLLEILGERVVSEPKAEEIMSRPARTISADASLDEAAAAMQRYGHSGLSVVEGDRLVGVISRRDADKARHHRLMHAPVKGFMSRNVHTASPEETLSILEARMIDCDVGRLPVLKDGRLVGVVTRGDLLRARHGARYAGMRRNLSARLEASAPKSTLDALRKIGETGDQEGIPAYLAGGFVRDLLMGSLKREAFAPSDLDLVAEGDALVLARKLAASLGAAMRLHARFGTASLRFPDGSHLDLATARTESYSRPAALPDVERSSIEDDLRRRDFTINAMAIHLGERRFGELLDPHKGSRDVRRREIRVLHTLSFVEDPTRLLRAARFEARFGFRMESRTMELAKDAIQQDRLSTLTPERFRRELLLCLSEEDVTAVIRRCQELGILERLSPGFHAEDAPLSGARDALRWFAEMGEKETPDRSLLMLAALLAALPPPEAEEACLSRLRLSPAKSAKIRRCLERGCALAEAAMTPEAAPLTRLLSAEPIEAILYAAAIRPESRETLETYLRNWRHVKLSVTGKDLIRLGFRPGPEFKKAMSEALDLKLSGILRTRERELEYIRERLEAWKPLS